LFNQSVIIGRNYDSGDEWSDPFDLTDEGDSYNLYKKKEISPKPEIF